MGFLPGALLKKTSLKAYIVVFVAGVLLRTLPGALISAPTREGTRASRRVEELAGPSAEWQARPRDQPVLSSAWGSDPWPSV